MLPPKPRLLIHLEGRVQITYSDYLSPGIFTTTEIFVVSIIQFHVARRRRVNLSPEADYSLVPLFLEKHEQTFGKEKIYSVINRSR